MPSPVHPYSDYGVALRTLKSARAWLGFLMFGCVLAQFIGFAMMWWTQQPYSRMRAEWLPRNPPSRTSVRVEELPASRGSASGGGAATSAPAAVVAEEPFFPGTPRGRSLNIRNQWETAYSMLVPLTQISALIAVSSQAIIVFVTLLVVLVAQAPGVAQITRSLIWSVLLLFMFLPWQYFARDFPIPGVIYSYTELLNFIGPHVVFEQAAGEHVYGYQIWLVYGRFIVWPLVGLLALLITSERFRAGVMIAIGHPLQSILQPRGGTGVAPIPGPVGGASKSRPLSLSPGSGMKRS